MIDLQKHKDLNSEIMSWLRDNRDTPKDMLLLVVKGKLSNASLDAETLLKYASTCFIAMDDCRIMEENSLNYAMESAELAVQIDIEGVERAKSWHQRKIAQQKRPKKSPTNKSLTMEAMKEWREKGHNMDEFLAGDITDFEITEIAGDKYNISWPETKQQKVSYRTLQDWWTDCIKPST